MSLAVRTVACKALSEAQLDEIYQFCNSLMQESKENFLTHTCHQELCYVYRTKTGKREIGECFFAWCRQGSAALLSIDFHNVATSTLSVQNQNTVPLRFHEIFAGCCDSLCSDYSVLQSVAFPGSWGFVGDTWLQPFCTVGVSMWRTSFQGNVGMISQGKLRVHTNFRRRGLHVDAGIGSVCDSALRWAPLSCSACAFLAC
jgi:hypothetical protein